MTSLMVGLPDCPECEGTGYITLEHGTSHEEPRYVPCTNIACYPTSDHVWRVWAPRGIFEFAYDYDGWEMNDAAARAIRERYFELRAAERRARRTAR